ncbi:MAG: ribosomal protein S18-alanine N-acetyltransferase [Geitlerinemataceae cyanobacterium]
MPPSDPPFGLPPGFSPEFSLDLSPVPERLSLRPATHADLEAIVELDRRCFGQLWSRETYARELDSPNSSLLLLGDARPQAAGEALVGYGCLWAIVDEAHVTILGVHPDRRRRGFGEVLLHALLSIARQRQLTRATLEVNTQNHAALALYEKIGFRRAGCRKGYYPNGDDAAILWKNGLGRPQFADELAAWRRDLQARMA